MLLRSPRELRARWRSGQGAELSRAVQARIRTGESLEGLGLGSADGRIDLRGIEFPEPSEDEAVHADGLVAQKLTGLVELRGVTWAGLDFAYARLPSFRMFDCRIVDSSFEDAFCRGWRAWGIEVSRVSFRKADLRGAMLGAWYEGRSGRYADVDFADADLRGVISHTPDFIDCDFSGARLDSVDFQSSGFVRCRFAGDLRDVVFWDHGFRTGKPDANPMEDVDFSDAHLRFVEFRRLNLDRVRLPTSSDHVVVTHYRCVLSRLLAALENDDSLLGRRSSRYLRHCLQWAGSNQEHGVFHIEDLGVGSGDSLTMRDQLLAAEARCAEHA